MKSNVLMVIIVVLVVGAGAMFFFNAGKTGEEGTVLGPGTNQPTTSTATNYDECIAEGNKPLPDAPDKCLTANGHVFIQGVIE